MQDYKTMNKNLIVCIGTAALLGSLSGCKTFDEYKSDRLSYAVKHFERSQYSDLAADKVLTLNECVTLAIRNNLDLKVFGIEEKVAKEMRTAEILGMLPELNVSNNLTSRDNIPASSSKQVDGRSGPGTYSYSQSQDRTVNYLNVDLALSVLDFGLAFFNTCQSNDRMLLRQQRTRRAEQNLVLDTVRVYFQVAASQRAINITRKLLADCKDSCKLVANLAEAGRITPFRAYDETKKFMEMEKRLTNYIRSYENSCIELRSLLGLYPNAEIKVDDRILDTVPEFKFPGMILMEQIALLKRPELYEIDMQKHINILECRKTIVTMFPNVRIFLDFTNSTNSFLYHYSWWEIGIRAAYNLLKLPQQIARYQAYSSQVDAEEYRAYAQAIAVMAQVRIANSNLSSCKEKLDIATRFYNVYSANLKRAEQRNRTSGELSQLEMDHMRLSTAETEVERYVALGNYYVSYYRILNTLGIENLHAKTVDALRKELEGERARAAAELERAKKEYEEKQNKQAKPQQAKPQQAKPQQAKPQQAKPQQAKPQQAKPQQAAAGGAAKEKSK